MPAAPPATNLGSTNGAAGTSASSSNQTSKLPDNIAKHTISVRVHNRPGVLMRVAQVFARRGFNIDSLVVSRGHQREYSRMTIACEGDPQALQQIIKQLNKLVDTIHAAEHITERSVEREMALIKVQMTPQTRAEIFQAVEAFKARVVDLGDRTLIVEVTGDSGKIDAFEGLLNTYGVLEMVRTGKMVIARGVQRT